MITSVQATDLPHPFLVIGESGVTETFTVRVFTRNAGNATAGPSETLLEAQDSDGTVVGQRSIQVGQLKPRQTALSVERIRLRRIGLIRLVAKANFTHTVNESDGDNNEGKDTPIPVIAQQWDAKAMSVSGSIPSGNFVDQIVRGELHFRFSYFDGEQFRYKAYGEVKAIWQMTGICTGHGEGTARHDPWSSGGLAIDHELSSYQAYVPAEREPAFKFPFYCGGHLVGPAAGRFVNLETLKGGTTKQPMRPTAKSLVDGSLVSGVRYSWVFRADVP